MRCSRIDVRRRLARLVAQGLLAFGAPRPPDGRMEIAVSERGRWVAKELDRRERAWMRRLLRGFSAAELEMLEALLARLEARANGASPTRAKRGA
jgi:DNA-binding MarR family transcriptional regulator